MPNGSPAADAAVLKFLTARANARKFHKQDIGDVDPQHCFSDFVAKVARNDDAGIRKEYGKTLDYWFGDALDRTGCRAKTALSISYGGPTGGYLVPPELALDVMTDVAEQAFVRPRATVVPMQSATLDLCYPDATTGTGVSGVPTFFGGMKMSWNLEAQARTESEPKFRQIELRAQDLGGYLILSNNMMNDGIAVDAWLRKLFASAVAWFEDYYFLQGTGTNQPTGVINGGGITTITRGSSGPLLADIANMASDLLPFSFTTAIWMASVSCMARVQIISGWVPNVSLESGAEKRDRAAGLLNNRPLYATEKLPKVGSQGDLILFDPTLYVIGDRLAMEISHSRYDPTPYPNNQSSWRVIHRVDGRPLFDSTITLADNSSVVSPYVVLK